MIRAFGLSAVLFVLPAPNANAQAGFEIPVPAGLKAFACGAGLPESLPAARLLPALVRRDIAMPAGTPEGLQAPQYLAWLGELQARLRATGSERDLVFRLASRRERGAVSDVIEWLGLRLTEQDGAFVVIERNGDEDRRRQALAACIGATVDVVSVALGQQQPLRLWPDDGTVYSPVAPAVWLSLRDFRELESGQLLTRLLQDRRAQLLYHGLMGLDDETLAWVTADPELLHALYQERSAPFAAFGHAIRVTRGIVAVPGGEQQRARWASLVDRDPSQAAEFVLRLLGRDDGALGDFFATLEALPEDTQTAIVAAPDFARLYQVFKGASSSWKTADNPFIRPVSDPGFALLTLLADGTPTHAGPAWRRVWEAGFDARQLSSRDAGLSSDVARGERAELSWLLASITSDVEAFDGRLALARFARRVFDAVPPADAGYAAVTLGAFQQFAPLFLELERAGMRSPAVFARAAEQARRLAGERPERGALTMVSWQAAMALVSALATNGAISADAAARLIDELSTLPTGRDGLWDGAIARYMRDHVVPLLPQPGAAPGGRSTEDALLDALAVTRGATDATFIWEGLEYRTTVTEARAARSRAIAREQERIPLDDLIALIDAADVLASATSASGVQAAMQPLTGIEDRFPAEIPWLFATEQRPFRPLSFIERQLRDARRVERDTDLSRGRRATDRFVWLTDLLTADTLAGILYAARLGTGLQSPSTVAAVWRRHEFGFRGAEEHRDATRAWRIPQIDSLPDGGWHMRGGLIGLDLALGESWLRRLAGGPPPTPTRLSDPDLRVLFRTQATFAMSPPSAALRPGTDVPGGDVISPRRRRLLAWIRASQPDRAATSTTWHDTARTPLPDVWGTTPSDVSCVCRTSVLWRPDESWMGRPLRATVVPMVPDLNLRVSAMAHEIGLPPIALPAVLAAAYQDLLDGASPAYADDWVSVATFANSLTRARFEEYVFALIATRELTPVQREP